MNPDAKILIVDDDPHVLFATARILKKAGYTVLEAESGEQGIRLAQETQPELMLLDVVLPDVDGYEVCRTLKSSADTAGIAIIICSGSRKSSESKSYGLDIGADEYITRPIENRELLARVNAMLRLRRAEQAVGRRKRLESLGVLAGGLAHDFNNILGVITGNISFAVSILPEKDEELIGVLEDIQTSARQAQSITNQMLTFAKGGAPIKEPACIESLVKEAAQFVIRGSNSRCEHTIPDEGWLAEIDAIQINHALGNVVLNSQQAMPEGGVISVSVEYMTLEGDGAIPLPPGRYVRIDVADKGGGIPEEHLPHVFDPYFTTKQRGSGFGLATAYSIITKHEGYISIESEVGQGTTVHIYLPVTDVRAQAAKQSDTKTKEGQGKILVLDDEEMLLTMADRMLARLGYSPSLSKDGAQTVELYREAQQSGEPFDGVILDLTVPGGMGGAATIRELLKIDPDVKAVVSSGYSNDPIMANYREYGFSAIAPKPYTMSELAKVLENLLAE